MKADHTTPRTSTNISQRSRHRSDRFWRGSGDNQEAAPGAEEKISYQIPSFTLKGHLVYFGAFKKHIGFYPPVRDKSLRRETSIYEGEKGNLRFPLDKPIPYNLISKIVKARVRENQAKGRREEKEETDCVVTMFCRSTQVTRSRWYLPPRHPIHPSSGPPARGLRVPLMSNV